MTKRELRAWDAPVVHALDEMEKMPGFEPTRVVWDTYRFMGTGFSGLMDAAFIFASPAPNSSEFVYFSVSARGFTMTDRERRELTAAGTTRVLNVPTESAEKAARLLKAALTASLAEYNAAHAPRLVVRATTSTDRPAPNPAPAPIEGPLHQGPSGIER